jgi:hypothetical protein
MVQIGIGDIESDIKAFKGEFLGELKKFQKKL